jgi:hypothetical protein
MKIRQPTVLIFLADTRYQPAVGSSCPLWYAVDESVRTEGPRHWFMRYLEALSTDFAYCTEISGRHSSPTCGWFLVSLWHASVSFSWWKCLDWVTSSLIYVWDWGNDSEHRFHYCTGISGGRSSPTCGWFLVSSVTCFSRWKCPDCVTSSDIYLWDWGIEHRFHGSWWWIYSEGLTVLPCSCWPTCTLLDFKRGQVVRTVMSEWINFVLTDFTLSIICIMQID